MDRVTSELLDALFCFQSCSVSAGELVSGISHVRSDQVEIMHFHVLDYENFSSMLRKTLFRGFRETVKGSLFQWKVEDLSNETWKSFSFVWVGWFSWAVRCALLLDPFIQVSSFLILADLFSAFNILYQFYCSALTCYSTVPYYCK